MKTTLAFLALAAGATAGFAQNQPATAGERPPVVQQLPAGTPPSLAPADSGQKLYAPENRAIIPPDQARAVVDKFAEAYAKLGKPRLLFYVNRELIDANSGLRLTKRTERTEADRAETKSDVDAAAPQGAPQVQVNVNGSASSVPAAPLGRGTTTASKEHVSAENTFEAKDAAKETLADRQTVRDVERLFGRPFRAAGASLADQRVAAALIADKPFDHFTASGNEQARKDREALGKIADVVIEVLISSREVLLPKVSGDQTTVVPDIQATAIRLSDSAIIGQASSRDVLGKDRDAGRIVNRFDVHDIAEATALALMEDMALGGK